MKPIMIVLAIMLVGVTAASAGELNIEQLLRSDATSTTYSAVGSDEASSYATSHSDEDDVSTLAISGVSTFGDSTLAGAFSQGEGDILSLGSLLHLEGDNLNGEGEASMTADEEAGTGSSASVENGDDYNTLDIEAIANGIGDASGYTWVFGWE